MSSQQYLSFFEKVTRKLADTFIELNQICREEIANLNQNLPADEPPKYVKQLFKPDDSLVQELQPTPIEIDQPQEEPGMKSPKTKKIKKDAVVEEEDRETESVRARRKIKKVSHKPKAPASSFLLFFKDQQCKISQGYPNYGVTELTKVAAKLWSELSAQEKQPYIDQCDEDRKTYQIKMIQYRQDFPQEIAEKEKDRQLKKVKKVNPKDSVKKEKTEPSSPKNAALQDSKTEVKQNTEPLKIVAEESASESVELEDDADDSLGMV